MTCYPRSAIADTPYVGALNWATGETVAIKEITLSNIPKAELGEIMVRRTRPDARSTVLTCAQSEIDLLKNLNVSEGCTRARVPLIFPIASQHREIQGLRQGA